jgi:hypothetical protein
LYSFSNKRDRTQLAVGVSKPYTYILGGEHNMENTMKMYVTADEAAQILGVSRGYAYKIIRGLNNELKEKGYRVISGKVPTKYFEEKFYGMAQAN